MLRPTWVTIVTLAILTLALIGLFGYPTRVAHAATFTVDSTADAVDAIPGDGVCNNGAGNCTLRAAIMEANALPGPDTIDLPSGTYTLTLGFPLPIIYEDLTLTGAGANSTIIQAATAPSMTTYPVFRINDGDVAISGVTIRHGNAPNSGGFRDGGGIRNFTTLTLTDVIISDNTGHFGGGIHTRGHLKLINSTVSGNTAVLGGGIYASATLTVIDSTISDNGAGGGGGIYTFSSVVTLTNSIVTGNTAGDGAGILDTAVLPVVTCPTCGTVLTNTTVSNNTAIGDGGGILLFFNNRVTLTDSTVSGNAAGSNGGGVYNRFSGGSMTLTNSTVSNNSAGSHGGGAYNSGSLTLRNTTISHNTTGSNGGAVYNTRRVALRNSTITGNTANGEGGGVHNNLGAVGMLNTVIAGNTAVPGPDCSGPSPITSHGHNLIGDTTGCDFVVAAGDLVGTGAGPIDPLLGPLQDNGGPTLTHALLPGSPAIDAGDNASCTATDQRGVMRPQGPACDIGAFELQSAPVEADLSVTKEDDPDPVLVGQDLVYTFTVTNNGPATATAVTLTDTLAGTVTFASATSTQGSCGESGGTVTCNLGILVSGATATITVVVIPETAGTISNTASVSASEPDPDIAKNTATQDTMVNPPDTDGDGIPDAQDACPNDAEDFDGFQDEDGCPEQVVDMEVLFNRSSFPDQTLNTRTISNVFIEVRNVGDTTGTGTTFRVAVPPALKLGDEFVSSEGTSCIPFENEFSSGLECSVETLSPGELALLLVDIETPCLLDDRNFTIMASVENPDDTNSANDNDFVDIDVLADQPDDAPCREKLARRFFPSFYFDRDEVYFPTNFYFDDDLTLDNNQEEYDKQTDDEKFTGNTVYVHTLKDDRYVVIQYWLYYAFDDKPFLLVPSHEHDWENVQVYLDVNDVEAIASGTKEITDLKPIGVRFAAHEGTPLQYITFCRWPDSPDARGPCFDTDGDARMTSGQPLQMQVVGSHPTVFVAEKQHGTFPTTNMPWTEHDVDRPADPRKIFLPTDFENVIYAFTPTTHPDDQHKVCSENGELGKFTQIEGQAFKGEHPELAAWGPEPGQVCSEPFPNPWLWPDENWGKINAPWEDEKGRWDKNSRWDLPIDNFPTPTGESKDTAKSALLVSAGSPVTFQVVSPSGQRVGIDPSSGEVVTEVSDGFFIEAGGPGGRDLVLILSPEAGSYSIQVFGLAGGTFDVFAETIVQGVAIDQMSLTDVPIAAGEIQTTTLKVPQIGGGAGFWLNRAPKLLPPQTLDSWVTTIDQLSEWLVLEAAGVFPDITAPVTYSDLQTILGGGKGRDMTTQFLRQYAALRLNIYTGFVSGIEEVDLSAVDPSGLVFSAPSATIAEIVQTIEDIAFFTDQGPKSVARAKLEIMKDVCELLNER